MCTRSHSLGMILVGGGADKVDNTLEATTGETVTLTCTLSQLKEEEVAVNYTWTRGDGKPLPDDSQETRGVCVCVYGGGGGGK